jgi:hypothetical protein
MRGLGGERGALLRYLESAVLPTSLA